MEFAAVTQKLSQEHLQSLLASRVVVEPHHANPSLLETPVREGAIVTDDMEDMPEDTTITEGVVVRAVVEMWDIMHYKKGTRMSIWTSQVLMPPTDGGNTLKPFNRREMPT